MMHVQSLFARMSRCDRGSSVIELGITIPFIASLILGLVDISRGYSARLELEQVAQRTIEMATVGAVGSNYSYLATEARSAAGLTADQVTVDNWLECNQQRQASFTGTCTTGQTTARYVSLALTDTYQPIFLPGAFNSWLNYSVNDAGEIVINADTVVRVQ